MSCLAEYPSIKSFCSISFLGSIEDITADQYKPDSIPEASDHQCLRSTAVADQLTACSADSALVCWCGPPSE